MNDLTRKLQARLGRDLTDREIAAIGQLVDEHGVPEISAGAPWFNGDSRRPVFVKWIIDGEERVLSLAPSAPAAKPRDLVREHAERLGGSWELHRRRIGLDGRRTVEVVRVHGARPTRAARSTTIGRACVATRAAAPSRGSPSDDSDSESSEPAQRRLCAYCGKDIPPDRSPKATHCSDRHADRDRQRRKRQRDRARSKLPSTPMPADFWRMLEISTEDRERLSELVVCRCNGHHLEFEPGWCTKCGHWLPDEITGGAKLYAAFMARLASRQEATA
jgi:hypothetical protein